MPKCEIPLLILLCSGKCSFWSLLDKSNCSWNHATPRVYAQDVRTYVPISTVHGLGVSKYDEDSVPGVLY